MTIEEYNQNQSSSKEIEEQEELINKEKEPKIDLSIKINRYSFIFFFLFVGLVGYLAIAVMIPLQPFYLEGEPIPDQLEMNEGLFVIIAIIALVFLIIGLYFNWFWKGPKKEKQTETEDPCQEKESIVFTSTEDGEKELKNNQEVSKEN